jgi:outer membrane protein assembly factor BamA
MQVKDYYIGFFRYDDSKIWNKTNLNEDEKVLREYLENLTYVDKLSINIRKIQLPE